MTPEEAAALRAPFPPELIGKLPRAGIELDFVGHAAVTDRLLQVDPCWTWEPMAFTEAGTPLVLIDGNNAVLWIKLTVCGVTRYGVGIVNASAFELQKQLISDALRNAAMRFGVALDLWSKEPLHAEAALPPAEPVASKAQVDKLNEVVDSLEPEQRSEFVAWKNDQGFPWPWPLTALEAMTTELERIVGAEASADTTDRATGSSDLPAVGEPSPVMDKEGSGSPTDASPASPAAGIPEELAGFSDEAF